MAHLSRIYLGAVAAMCSSIAAADALHGFCSDCTGDSPVGATAAGSPIDFGFWDAGKNNSGQYFIDILTPDNSGSTAPSGKYSITGGASGTASLFSSAAWTSGKLSNYLGISASPANPLSAWLHATQSLDPKAMGYWVFQANLGLNSLGTSSGTGPLLALNSSLPQGSVVVAFLETSTSDGMSASHGEGNTTSRGKGKNDDNDNGNNNDQGKNGDDDNQGKGKGKGQDMDHGKGKNDNQGKGQDNNDQGQGNDNQGKGQNNEHGKGKNSNSFTATANGSALFEIGLGGSSGQPNPQPGGGGSGATKPGTPTTTPTGRSVPEPGTVVLLLTGLLGFGVTLLSRRTAFSFLRLPRPITNRRAKPAISWRNR